MDLINLDKMDLKYFKKNEFLCKCGCGENSIQESFLAMLDNARDISGIAYKISSGTRCATHNKNIGGVSDSAHISGYAADIVCKDSRSRALIRSGLMEAGFTRLGVAKSFIHSDNDPNKPKGVVWVY